ncbi:hypothetical protein UFOVP816_27 [uncultured Caudovirales phage]|uniref:Helix-turn-helix domain containing protein n=1 Tax=uncultured Caudovirales phage TaxID=2100421 RepID=A0A6J5NZX8_9CAUD|nr:hypothetical protein UFOVP816_27 [uncultured Caudovirales phage]
MTIFRVQHNKNYTVINNTICTDKRLSWKAKGIFLYAFSRPDNWQFHIDDLIKQSSDGEKSVKAGLRELADCGYLLRVQSKKEGGKFGSVDWTFFETPQEIKEILPQADFRLAENGLAQNDPLLSTEEKLSTDKTKYSPPTPSKAKAAKAACVCFGSHVKLNQNDYDKMCSEKTKEYIDNLIAEMNDYCAASRPGGYADYAAALRQWIERRKNQPKKATPVSNKDKVLAKFKHYEHYNGALCLIDDNGIAFDRGMTHYELKFSEKGFDEQLANILRKLQIS